MMARRKAPVEMGYRTYEEFCRIFEPDGHGNMERAVQLIGCDFKTPYGWKEGLAPDPIYLARLCGLGADVVWILTGQKTGETIPHQQTWCVEDQSVELSAGRDKRTSEIIHILADCSLNVSEAARRLSMCHSAVKYQIRKVRKMTGLDPLNFHDLCKLLVIMDSIPDSK